MFRCYRQVESADCGITCIRMIARHYGKKIPARHLQGIADLNRLGMSIKDISDCCEKVGLQAVPVKLGIDHMAGMPLPAILYWQQRHFVVLHKIDEKKGRYHIADPAQGLISHGRDELERYWLPDGDTKGLAILTEPNEDFPTKSYDRDNTLNRFKNYILGFIRNHKRNFGAVLLITLLIMAADFCVPLMLKRTIDEGIGLRDVGLVAALLLGQLAIMLGGLVSSKGMEILLTKTGLNLGLEMSNHYLERLARFPLSYFDKKVSSDFVQKVNDHDRIKEFLLSFPNTIIITTLTLAVFSVLLFHYSPFIFFLFLALSIVEILWNALFLSRRKSLDYAFFTNASESRNHTYELTNGMADLKVNNAERSRTGKWKQTQSRLNDVAMKTAWLSLAQSSGHSAISRIKELSVTGIAAAMVIYGDMTMGVMMTLGYITGRLSQPFSTISSSISQVQSALLSFQRIDDVISDTSELRGREKYSEPSIRLENVWFKYAGGSSPFVIKDFSLTVEKGKVTALVGESGCGKSTLVKLMLGFYIPQKGEITLSGHSVKDIDNSEWLSHCGVVMQDGKIFSGSILENITLSDEKPDLAKATEAIEAVGLTSFIATLPMKVYTTIGTYGLEISGGQKQRLLIARALYKNPDILFLDEATSSLDANNERNIVDKVTRFGTGKTIVIAAHRLSTVQNADRIVYIENGSALETGTHAELCERKGAYWRLVKNQLQLSI